MDTISNSNDPLKTSGSGSGFIRIRNRIASTLREVGEMLPRPRELDSTSNDLSRIGNQIRDWIGDTANQIERVDPVRVQAEFTSKVQRNPGTSLLIAATAGLLLGIVVRRR